MMGKRRVRIARRVWSAMFILLFVFGISASFAAEKRTAKVQELYGTVEVRRAASEKRIKAFKNMVIQEGDKIFTGKDSKIVMKVDKDKEVTLAADTIATLSELKGGSDSNDTVITIQAGGVGSKIEKKLDKDSSYKIKTPTAVMGVRGTHFYVQVEKPEKKLSHPEVNIWLSKGVIEVEYRKEGTNISKYTENKGQLTSFLMTAPKKFDFPSEGKVDAKPEQFDLKGLYKEFIDYDDLSDLYDEDEIEKAKKEAERDEEDDDEDEEEPEEVRDNPYYEDIRDDRNEDDDDDESEDDESSAISSKPAGDYVFVGKYEIVPPAVPARIEGTVNRWVNFDRNGSFGFFLLRGITGNPSIPADMRYTFSIDDIADDDFMLGDILIDD